jgi:hypothetical protein
MKLLLLSPFIFLSFASCKTTKNYSAHSREDKKLYDILSTLNKSSKNKKATKSLPAVYAESEQNHLNKINSYKNYTILSRWDSIFYEYKILQTIYYAVKNTDTSNSIIKPTDYQNYIVDTRLQAAEDYYKQATVLLKTSNKNDSRKAYNYFREATIWIPGYKDSETKIDEVYNKAVLNVIISPLLDSSNVMKMFLNRSDFFQDDLVRGLGGKDSSFYPARFYTEAQAIKENIKPDWKVYLVLRNVQLPKTALNSSYTYTTTRPIEDNIDSLGRTIYKNVSAQIYVSNQPVASGLEMVLKISEFDTGSDIFYDTYKIAFSTSQQAISYVGDIRAFSDYDRGRIDNISLHGQPTVEGILNSLYTRAYPKIKNKINDLLNQ